jgi:hypothetical protein
MNIMRSLLSHSISLMHLTQKLVEVMDRRKIALFLPET